MLPSWSTHPQRLRSKEMRHDDGTWKPQHCSQLKEGFLLKLQKLLAPQWTKNVPTDEEYLSSDDIARTITTSRVKCNKRKYEKCNQQDELGEGLIGLSVLQDAWQSSAIRLLLNG